MIDISIAKKIKVSGLLFQNVIIIKTQNQNQNQKFQKKAELEEKVIFKKKKIN
jgi:hypothetical protein